MTMNPKSAQTLVWTALIVLVLGLVVPSPAGSIFLFGLGAICALIPTALARKGTQLGAALALIAALALVAVTYPKYQEHMDDFAKRAKSGKR